MLVLGLQGSPRKNGNTNYLLNEFMSAVAERGAAVEVLHAPDLNIRPCLGCGNCERKGFCAIKNDDMVATVYPLLRRADVIVLASPVYFYNVTAQLKTLIDRSQALWARKYKHGLDDPGRNHRKGLLLSVGATRGKNLFDGMSLTGRYFFDAVGSEYTDLLGYWRIEDPGELARHPGVKNDVSALVEKINPLFGRKKILFTSRENACRTQMASAFAQKMAGDRIEALHAGREPAKAVNPDTVTVMAEAGIDMAYRTPRSLDAVLEGSRPDQVVTIGSEEKGLTVEGVGHINWDLPDTAGQSLETMREMRDDIRRRVASLLG